VYKLQIASFDDNALEGQQGRVMHIGLIVDDEYPPGLLLCRGRGGLLINKGQQNIVRV